MFRRIHRQSGVLKAEFVLARPSGQFLVRISVFALCALALIGGPLRLNSLGHAQGISLNDEIIADPITGAALLGFDPVGYFIDNRPVAGDRGRQLTFAGKVWYFASNANKSAFEANPAIYLPAFGGHDPVAIAAGFAVSGSPEFFAIANDKVFLFRHPESRDAFTRDPAINSAAERFWPQVKRDMVP